MKKILKAGLSLLICASTVLSLSSCENPKEDSTSQTEKTTDVTTVTAFCPNTASMPMSKDVLLIKELSERTKTNFEFTVSPATGTEEKFNLMMASGTIPDMVIYVQDPIIKYKDAFEPLNELINSHCPNYAKLMEKYPYIKKDLTAVDGKIYTMNSIASTKFANAFIVRRDWLEKLNLETPKTLDDFYKVLKAFKDNDPNGNGKDDEVPLISPSLRRADAESPGLSIFAACFGIDEDFYLSEDGNKILYGATDPRMKEVLTYLNKLYSEKLIDQEYLTRDWASCESLQAEEKAGMWIDWGAGVDSTLITNPKRNLDIILPPEGKDGKVRTFSQMPQVRTNAIAISKKAKNKEHIMSIFNYIFSEEGQVLMGYGVEGKTFDMVDGKPAFSKSVLESDDGPLKALRKEGINSWLVHKQIKEEYFSDEFHKAAEAYEKVILPPVPPLKFTNEEKSTINSKYNGEIKTFLDESLDGFITGKISLDNFDKFVKQLNDMGLQSILDTYNNALERYNSIK